MNVLQISYSDYAFGGGGAIAMYRLYTGLKNLGVDCKILSSIKTLDSEDSQCLPRKGRIENSLQRIIVPFGLNDIHRVGAFWIKKHPFYQQADILNFHVLHSKFFNYLAIPFLTKEKPAVWTFHDMWSFTGHCAYSYDCNRWKTGCGRCPSPEEFPSVRRDMTAIEWKLKHWVARHARLHIAAQSHWVVDMVKQSLFQELPVSRIPSGLDTNLYQPCDPEQCRSILGIPPNKKILMFGAVNLEDVRKGGDLLLQALRQLPASLKKEVLLITIGEGGKKLSQAIDMEMLHYGYTSSDQLKVILYSAADIFVFPSRLETFGIVLQESMACGTPLVAFKTGGVPDVVRPGITGYLAKTEDPRDFCQGIVKLLEDQHLREQMGRHCRAISVQEYSLERYAQKYLEVYHELLQKA